MAMHLLHNIKLNISVTRDHYEARIQNFVRVRHEVQTTRTAELTKYKNKSAVLINLRNAACIRKHVQTVARNMFGKPTGRTF